MLKNSNKDSSRSIRIAVIALSITAAVLIALFIIGYALLTDTAVMQDKDYILGHLEQSIIDNTESGSASILSFLDDAGIAGYNRRMLRTAESYFHIYYPFDLPSAAELARETATLFIEYCYDNIDLGNKTAVTDALIRCYVEATGDTWAVYRTEEEYEIYDEDMSGNIVGIGVTVYYADKDTVCPTVESVIPDSPAHEAGIMTGDIIIAVDGVSCEKIGRTSLASAIRGEEGTQVQITLLRDGAELTVSVTRRLINEPTVYWEIDGDGIAYIRITKFKATTDEQFKEAIDAIESAGAIGVIFDLRSNPGGYLDSVVNALSYLVPYGTDIVSFRYASEKYDTVYTADDYHTLTIPCAVLCNENTASAGELFTAGIRDYCDMGLLEGVTVGAKTYGKGVMQSTFEIGSGSTLTLTVALYNPPSGVNYEGLGVLPDFDVKYAQGDTDPQLDKAMEELYKLIATEPGAAA